MNNRTLVLDDVRRPTPAAPQPPSSSKRLQFRPPRPAVTQPRRNWQRLQVPLLLLAGLAGGFVAESLAIGLTLLAAYGMWTWVRRIPSRTSFMLALLLLIAICALLLFRPERTLISNFATYTFVLLLIGAITLGRESRLPKRLPHRYRR